MHNQINIFLSLAFLIISLANYALFAALKSGIHKLKCQATNVFTTDMTNTLNYEIEKLLEYNVLVAFQVINMPEGINQNKLQIEHVAKGGNFSRDALKKAKRFYYTNSIHKCVLTTFPRVSFTTNVDNEKIKRKVYHILTGYIIIAAGFSMVATVAFVWDQYVIKKY